jgi:3-methyladenine DNA glycosylase/8-oxoguanine DNA glycosylase
MVSRTMNSTLKPIKLEYETQLELHPQGPFCLDRTLSKSTRFGAEWYALTPFEVMHRGAYYAALSFDFFPDLGLKIRSVSHKKIVAQVFSETPLTDSEQRYIFWSLTRWLGIWEDLSPFYRMVKAIPKIGQAVSILKGMHETRCLNVFEATAFCLALQRATSGRTLMIIERLCESMGPRLRFDGIDVIAFPRAETVSRLTEPELRSIAPLGYRAKYLLFNAKALSRLCIDGGLLESFTLNARRLFLSQNFSGLGQYSAEILDPCGIPLDSWSLPIINRFLHIDERDDRAERTRERFVSQFGPWSRTAFIYLINYACRNE